jgi:signal transduction histidine kinase
LIFIKNKIFLFLTFFCSVHIVVSQTGVIQYYNYDSLQVVVDDCSDNKQKIATLLYLASIDYSKNNSTTAFTRLDFLNRAHNIGVISNNLDYASKKADSIGVANRNRGKYNIALMLHEFALEISENQPDKSHASICLNNIGVVYRRINEYDKAIEFHIKALKIAEELGEQKSQAIAINSIGNIQMALGNYEDAMNYFQQSLELEKKLNNRLGTAINLNNLGNIFFIKQEYKRALEYYNLSLDINKSINSKRGIAICYSDIGQVYQMLDRNADALNYYQKALSINIKNSDKIFLSDSYIHMGDIYLEEGRYSTSLKYILHGLKIAKEIGSKDNIMKANLALYKIDKQNSKFQTALQYYDTFHIYKDSISSISLQKDIARMRIDFESKRNENMISILEQKSIISNLELKRHKIFLWLIFSAFIIALGAVTFLTYYLYAKSNSNRILKRKNKEIDKANSNLEKLAVDLLAAKQEAERSNKIKSEFLANISHEIRTPLNSVVGYGELLARYDLDKVQKDYLNSIQLSANSLLVILNDILDLSKIEAGKFSVEYNSMMIRPLFEELEVIFKNKPHKNDVELNIVVDKNIVPTINFSEIRLRQILLNLISNAIKFTDDGFVTVMVNTERLENPKYVNLEVEIHDTGQGIPLEEQKNIFEPFYQLEGKNSMNGTGLGLAITKRLVDVLNGELSLISVENIGSVFKLFFSNVEVLGSDEITFGGDANNEISLDDLLLKSHDFGDIQGLLNLSSDINEIAIEQPYLREKLVKLYLNEFKLARDTGLIDNMLLFNSLLGKLADESNHANLRISSKTLSQLIKQINIEGIEKYFAVFESAIKKIISK